MKTFRKIIFWMHLIFGLSAGIFIFIMCVTGALLSFEKNIIQFAERDMRAVEIPSENARRLPLNDLVGKVIEAKPNAKPSNITYQKDKSAAASVALGREGQVFVNPYNGEITGEGATNLRSFFGIVEDAHRWLAFSGGGRQVGKSLNDAANLLFLMLAISGVYIWFPREFTRRHLAPILWFRRTNSGKARDFNWHNVFGFWSSLVLILLTITGVIISYQWAGNLLYTLTGNDLPPQQQQNQPNQQTEQAFVLPENLENSLQTAENHTNWKTISLRLPIVKDSAVFTIEEGIYWNILARSTLTVDPKTAQISKWEPYGGQNTARKLRSWARFTHTGETGGFIGQLIGFVACIGGAVLVFTGISLAIRRFWHWRSRRTDAGI